MSFSTTLSRLAVAALVLLATGAAKPQAPAKSATPPAATKSNTPPPAQARLAAVYLLPELRLELMLDARIAQNTQRDLETAHWFGIARNRKLEQLLAARPMTDAVLRLVSPQGKVMLRAALDTPFATLERLPPAFMAGDVFLLTSAQGGFGQDVLAVGQLLTVEAAGLRAVGAADEDGRVTAIRLLRGGKTDWRFDEDEGAILQVECIVDPAVTDGFREVHTTYRPTPEGWRLTRSEALGWCDWP